MLKIIWLDGIESSSSMHASVPHASPKLKKGTYQTIVNESLAVELSGNKQIPTILHQSWKTDNPPAVTIWLS